VVTSIIDLARILGFATIAEGVETSQQLDYLDSKKCDEIQGFIYSPALPAEDCRALMLAGKPGLHSPPANKANGALAAPESSVLPEPVAAPRM
jgi:predicted signal transduction protein with EAL and GGDEF domain